MVVVEILVLIIVVHVVEVQIVSPMVQLRYTLKRTALDKMLLGDEEGEGAQYASLAADDPGPSDEEFFKPKATRLK